jgi:maltose alpha-D-glucosyltransferase/alpha-amylase
MVIRISGQEQSNSSAVVEDTLVIKFYRQVAPGIHPEIEMGTFLTERAGFANSPAVLGSIRLKAADGEETALAVLHAFVRAQGDGWSYTLAYLDRFLQESRVAPVTEEAQSSDAHAAYRAQIERLGLRTAEMHRALHVTEGDPNFIVEPVAPERVAEWADGVAKAVGDRLDALARQRGTLPEEAVAIVASLVERKAEILDRIRAFAAGANGVLASRLHGDYHLGQVLVVRNDVFIVDFEGAPQLPLAERRRKHSVIRDTAGMLRSFDYAAWSALDRATQSQPDRRNELQQAARLWRDDASRSFLNTYKLTMAGCPLWPEDEGVASRLLTLFQIEKATLEIAYELGNRPDWVLVPLRGLQTLLST